MAAAQYSVGKINTIKLATGILKKQRQCNYFTRFYITLYYINEITISPLASNGDRPFCKHPPRANYRPLEELHLSRFHMGFTKRRSWLPLALTLFKYSIIQEVLDSTT